MERESFVREKVAPNNTWLAVFEDDGDTGYLYLCKLHSNDEYEIVDALWIYNQINPSITECNSVYIMWSDDSSRVAFIVDRECWGMLDLVTRRKLSAPRENGIITNIHFEKWTEGINPNEGEPLELNPSQ